MTVCYFRIPLIIGPIICPLGHILLSVLACLKDAVTSTGQPPHHDSAEAKSTIIECGLIFAFILVRLCLSLHLVHHCQCDQIWQQLFSPNLPHSLANFGKVSKSSIFLLKSFLGNFYGHLAIFSGHTDHCHKT